MENIYDKVLSNILYLIYYIERTCNIPREEIVMRIGRNLKLSIIAHKEREK